MPYFSAVDMGKTLEYQIRKESFSQAVIWKISHWSVKILKYTVTVVCLIA